MTRFIFSLFAVALAGLVHANPVQEPLAPIHTMESWAWSDCGSASDRIQIKSIEVSPDPPKPGEDLTVKVVATALDVVEEGAYADVTVKLGLIKLLHKEFDICEEARKAEATVQCPIEKGEYHVSQTVALPREIPRAKFVVQVRGYTVDDEDLLCLDLSVNFIKKPFFQALGW